MPARFKAVGISLPKELIEKIDRLRGDVPRSVFIRKLIEKQLRQQEVKRK